MFGQTRKLAGVHRQAGIGAEGLFSALKWVFSGASTDQRCQTGRVTIYEPERLIHGETAATVSGTMIVIAHERYVAKEGVRCAFLIADSALSGPSAVTWNA